MANTAKVKKVNNAVTIVTNTPVTSQQQATALPATNTVVTSNVISTTTHQQQANALAQAKANIANKVPAGVGVTLHTNGAPIKGLNAQLQIAKPTLAMCRYISQINTHPMQGNCVKRWHLYKLNQTLLCAKLTNGQTPNDLTYWAGVKHNGIPYIVLSLPTQAQYNAIVALWQNKQLTPANIQHVIATVK